MISVRTRHYFALIAVLASTLLPPLQEDLLAENVKAKVLNNLVIELLNAPAPPPGHQQHRVTNPRDFFLFISSDAEVKDSAQLWLVIDSADKKNAEILTKNLELVEFFEALSKQGINVNKNISWITIELLRVLLISL